MNDNRNRRLTRTVWRAGIGCAMLALAAGCSNSPYDSDYGFYPQPALVEVYHRGATEQTPLTVLASVLGVRRADVERHIPYSVAVRLRFENNGPSRVTFDPHSLELVTGALRAFSPPITEPANVIDMSPNQRREVTAYFPFPPNTTAGQMSLDNLRLRWEVRIDDHPVPQTAVFQRTEDGYDQTPQTYDNAAVY